MCNFRSYKGNRSAKAVALSETDKFSEMKRIIAEKVNKRCCVFEVLMAPFNTTIGKR